MKQEESLCSGAGCWESVRSGFDHVRSFVHYEVKNGSRALLWPDVWCGNQPFQIHLLNLFKIIQLEEGAVQEVVSRYNSQTS